jgi:hypothetical protein
MYCCRLELQIPKVICRELWRQPCSWTSMFQLYCAAQKRKSL